MRILITGGAGFIGWNLVRRLLSDGDSVAVIDDLSTGHRENLVGLDVDFVEASILDDNALSAAMKGAESVIHLAAVGSVPRSITNPIASHHANATGTLLVLEAARTNGTHVIAASSSSVYGSVPDLPRTESLPTRPMSPYAACKLATEAYVLAYGMAYELPTLAFRFFNVYGPRQSAGHAYAAVIPVFIYAALRGLPLPLHGDGLQSCDFTFVDTVTWVLADAARRQVTSTVPLNLALGTDVTLIDLIAHLESRMGRPLTLAHGPDRPGDVRGSRSDPQLLRTYFPGMPVIPFDEGLDATLAWFAERQSSPQNLPTRQ